MTAEQKETMTWLEYRSAVTGLSIDELRADMKARGAKGGAPKGRPLTELHKQRISDSQKKRNVSNKG